MKIHEVHSIWTSTDGPSRVELDPILYHDGVSQNSQNRDTSTRSTLEGTCKRLLWGGLWAFVSQCHRHKKFF